MNSTNPFSKPFNAAPPSHIATQQQLERLWKASPSLRNPKRPTPWYQKVGRWLVAALTDTQQVRVWTKVTPQGIQWNVYDPRIQRSFSCYSEADLRTWLEQRHYH